MSSGPGSSPAPNRPSLTLSRPLGTHCWSLSLPVLCDQLLEDRMSAAVLCWGQRWKPSSGDSRPIPGGKGPCPGHTLYRTGHWEGPEALVTMVTTQEAAEDAARPGSCPPKAPLPCRGGGSAGPRAAGSRLCSWWAQPSPWPSKAHLLLFSVFSCLISSHCRLNFGSVLLRVLRSLGVPLWGLVAVPGMLDVMLALLCPCRWLPMVTWRSLLATDMGLCVPWGLFPDTVWVPSPPRSEFPFHCHVSWSVLQARHPAAEAVRCPLSAEASHPPLGLAHKRTGL